MSVLRRMYAKLHSVRTDAKRASVRIERAERFAKKFSKTESVLESKKMSLHKQLKWTREHLTKRESELKREKDKVQEDKKKLAKMRANERLEAEKQDQLQE